MKNRLNLLQLRLLALFGAFALTVTSFIAYMHDETAGLYCAAVTLCYLLLLLVLFLISRKSAFQDGEGENLSTLTIDFLSKLSSPVLLISDEDTVAWYNRAFSELDSGVRYGAACHAVLEGALTLDRIKAKAELNDASPLELRVGDKSYSVSYFKTDVSKKEFYLTLWTDITELTEAKLLLRQRNVLVAYIVVDNMSEITQGIQDSYRESSAKIGAILSEWAASLNGILKEYERDKYILLFEERYMNEIVAGKFEILDRINAAGSADFGVPLTVSIGLAQTDGALAEKENAAKISLQLALQRGGAQAVVKTETGSDVYGGRTKSVQKRTKIRSRVIASELVNELRASSNVLVFGHKNADYDSIGACVGVARLAMYHKIQVNIVVNENDAAVVTAKQMLKHIPEYESVFTDGVCGQEMLQPKTLVVITDVSNPDLFESPEIFANAPRVVIIDHHRQAREFDRPLLISYIEPTASSASELISEILEYALPPSTVCKEEAELLFAGILLDTQRFSRNTGIRTFGAAVYLRSEGGNPGNAQSLFKYGVSEFMKLAILESNVILFRGIIAISQYDADNEVENRVIAAQAADRMLNIENIKASFVLALVGDAIQISARSDGSINVSLILEKLKGGGHFDMAGARLTGVSMKQALIMLRESIVEYLDSGNKL